MPGLALYAIFFQAATASLDALLADTLPPPKRTGAYAVARTLQTSSRALGPGLQAGWKNMGGWLNLTACMVHVMSISCMYIMVNNYW